MYTWEESLQPSVRVSGQYSTTTNLDRMDPIVELNLRVLLHANDLRELTENDQRKIVQAATQRLFVEHGALDAVLIRVANTDHRKVM